MKKSLLAVALLGTFGVALAQSSVTMYGTVDAGIAYTKGQAAGGRVVSLQSGQQSYSRIGFKGTEDLGGKWKAIFLLEQGIQIDTGSSGYATKGSGIPPSFVDTLNTMENNGTFSSQAYVGLASNTAGSVKLGRQYSPIYDAYLAIDPFMNGFAGNINNFFGTYQSGTQQSVSLFQRMGNSVRYDTPEFQGFKGALAYSFGEVPGSISSGGQIGISAGYENGPLTIAYAYHRDNNDLLLLDVFKTHFIGAAYDFGVLKLHGAVDQNKLAASYHTRDYMIGVTVPFGSKFSFFADYTRKQDKIYSNSNASKYAIGTTYSLSKRTNLYAAYAHVKNDALSQIATDVRGSNVNTFQIGMRHMF